ncbi:MAG: MraY family glycosyltransferase [Inhella sp.]|uniref:MraY family glycosyltransferase n=2 Tax=Inhella sp. TaxID=1921806 RepID=UPI00391CC312
MSWLFGSAFVAFAVALVLALLLVRSARLHVGWSGDLDLDGPQKFHDRPVPRVGGLAVWGGMLAGTLCWVWDQPEHRWCFGVLLVASTPAFLGGLLEDVTKKVRPAMRMGAVVIAALLAAWWLGAILYRTDIPGIETLVSTTLGALAVTVFVVAGVANAINIIDGFNGLASMCAMIMLAGLVVVALQLGDNWIAAAGLLLIGATLGLFTLNYPMGLIFLGDGGSYFLGFMVAELGILLIGRHPDVSPLFPLVLCAYPVVETLFTMYRRKVLRGRPVHAPDGVHLHSLIYRRLVRWALGSRNARLLVRRNSLTAPYLWVACSLSVVPAIIWWDSSAVLAGVLLAYVAGYIALYRRIVRFRTPRWLLRR